jgi:hypothetical protein
MPVLLCQAIGCVPNVLIASELEDRTVSLTARKQRCGNEVPVGQNTSDMDTFKLVVHSLDVC